MLSKSVHVLQWVFGIALLLTLAAMPEARADQHYSGEVFFENSLAAGSYPYSKGTITAPSALHLVDGKLPVETREYISGPNALELRWTSAVNGGWDAELDLYRWRNRIVDWRGSSLFLWLWSEEGIAAGSLPKIALADLDEGHTAPLPLGMFAQGLAPKHWMRIEVPLARFRSTSLKPFAANRLGYIVLSQDAADGAEHTLYLDDVRIESGPALTTAPRPPSGLRARGYERHVDLEWTGADDPTIAQHVIYRSLAGGPYHPVGVQRYGVNRYTDYLGDAHTTATYKVAARTSALAESPMTDAATATASTHPMTDDELLTMVEEASFLYYC